MIGRMLKRGLAEARSTLVEPDDALRDLLGGGKTNSGVVVNEERALRQTAVAACVRVVTETVGDLPCLTYEREGEFDIREAPEHPYASVMRLSPNPEMLAIEFWENFTAYGMLWAHACAYINRRRNGTIELWPLPPNRIELAREKVPTGAAGKYVPGPLIGINLRLDNGDIRFIPWRSLMRHAPFGYTGGKTPIKRHAETIGLALAAEEYSARFFGQGASAGGFIKMPPEATQAEADRSEAKFRARSEGLERAHLIGVLEGGASWEEVGMSPQDAQLIDARQFGVEEIARCFRTPLSKIQHLLRAHFANIEHEGISWVVDTIGPWCTRNEQAMRRDVWGLSTYGKVGDRWSEFSLEKLLRGDNKSVADAYSLAVQWGWMTRNDVRRKMRMKPLDGLDEPLTPLNMHVGDPTLIDDADPDARNVANLAALLARSHGGPLNGNGSEASDRVPSYLPAST